MICFHSRTTRYFKFELYPKGAISKTNLPPFLTTWLDRSSPNCMFTTSQLSRWTTPHLQSGAWFLECSQGFVAPEELALFESIKDSVGTQSQFDEFIGLEGEARSKALKKRELEDKKKLEKWELAKKKLEDNELKKRE